MFSCVLNKNQYATKVVVHKILEFLMCRDLRERPLYITIFERLHKSKIFNYEISSFPESLPKLDNVFINSLKSSLVWSGARIPARLKTLIMSNTVAKSAAINTSIVCVPPGRYLAASVKLKINVSIGKVNVITRTGIEVCFREEGDNLGSSWETEVFFTNSASAF